MDRADVTWPDLSLGLTRAFHAVWDRLAGKESAVDKKSRQAVERAIETMRRGQPASGRPSTTAGRARAGRRADDTCLSEEAAGPGPRASASTVVPPTGTGHTA